jgi:hypothetical protein
MGLWLVIQGQKRWCKLRPALEAAFAGGIRRAGDSSEREDWGAWRWAGDQWVAC